MRAKIVTENVAVMQTSTTVLALALEFLSIRRVTPVKLLLKYDIIDRLHENTAIAWGQLACPMWEKITECDVKSGQQLINNNGM